MPSIEEKRVYEADDGGREAVAATGIGVVRVAVSDDLIGEFGVQFRCRARDVAVADGRTLAAAEDVFCDGDATDHGPAVAVTLSASHVVAAAPDGVVSRRSVETLVTGPDGAARSDDSTRGETDATHGARDSSADGAWERVGEVGEVRCLSGPLVGTDAGVFRIGDGLEPVGLSDVRDLAGRVPHAATGDGCYRLANGWQRVGTFDGPVEAVAVVGDSLAAATREAVHTRDWWTDGWSRHPIPDTVALAGAGETLLALTEQGTLHAAVGDGWRDRALGVTDPAGLAFFDPE
ncbi:MAG: hypothetical protein ABEI75_05035 [Halobaculum sp.]